MHRPRIGQAAQGLRRHRSLHRVEVVHLAAAVQRGVDAEQRLADGEDEGVALVDGYWVLRDRIIGIAEIPGEVVIVAEDMAARAGRLAISGEPGGGVEA